MKKLQQWYNGLSPRKQKLALLAFCLLFTVALIISICYQRFSFQTGYILQPRIKNETIKHR